MPKINSVVFDSTIDPIVVPGQAAQISLDATSYSADENSSFEFNILRADNTSQIVTVDWAITNANVSPTSGQVVFTPGDTNKPVVISTLEVGPTEIGQLEILDAVASSGTAPELIAPSSATVTVVDTDASVSQTIPTISLEIGEVHDMSPYIYNPDSSIKHSIIDGLDRNIATYYHANKLLTGVALSSLANYTLRAYSEVVKAFPGAEGFGTETTHGRGGVVYQVTNLNDSGPGSLREALLATESRIVIFRVSGTIELATRITMESANSNCYIAGESAPGDGICVRMAAGSTFGSPIRMQNCSNVVMRHMRVRHGCPASYDVSTSDSLTLLSGNSYIVIDHCSFTWGNDEAISIFGSNQNNITVSHCIIGEGVYYQSGDGGHNLGPLYSGQNDYNICTHHNLYVHIWYRSPRYQMSGTGSDGCIQANNVHYNVSSTQATSVGMNSYLSTSIASYLDVINDYYKAGLNSPADLRPFTLNKDGTGTYPDVQILFEGSTFRNIDGTSHPNNNEANNYEIGTMMRIQLSPAGNNEPINYTIRTERLAQPTNEITITSAEQAYTDLIIDGDVGATKPVKDSVDTRLTNAPINGDGWDSTNIPAPKGTGSYPTLSTYDVPDDTSGNGLPDYYQVGVLGKDINDAYNPAATYTVGNGYSDIENWFNSL